MASTTPNIGLTLPTGAEKVSRQVINANNTIIDDKMGAVPGGQNLQGEIDALNSKLRMTGIMTQLSIPTTETSYSCNWSIYRILVIHAVFYGNVVASIVVPTSYFSTTSNGQRVLITDPISEIVWDVYRNGNNAVYMKATKADNTRGITIYGFI